LSINALLLASTQIQHPGCEELGGLQKLSQKFDVKHLLFCEDPFEDPGVFIENLLKTL
jgi:hypothetical protein